MSPSIPVTCTFRNLKLVRPDHRRRLRDRSACRWCGLQGRDIRHRGLRRVIWITGPLGQECRCICADIQRRRTSIIRLLRSLYELTQARRTFTCISISAPALVLIENKIDLEKRQVLTDEGRALATEFACVLWETSALRRQNVEKLILEVVRPLHLQASGLEDNKVTTSRLYSIYLDFGCGE